MAQFKYVGTRVTNQNLIQEEIKRGLNFGNACYHSVQKILSSRLLSTRKNVKIRIYKIIILLVFLHGCETWSLTWSEQHRWRVFEKRLLRRIFASMKDKITRGWRKFHNEELHMYSSPDIIRMFKSRRMRRAGHIACMGRSVCRVLIRKLEGRRPVGRHRRRW
jgi:hypothetical protein